MQLPHACACCRSFIRTDYGLCTHCTDKLFRLRSLVARTEPIRTRALFEWGEAGPPAFGWVIRALKGAEAPGRWLTLAAWMVEAFGPPKPQAVLVPVPSRGPNHALGICRAIRELTGAEIQDELRVKTSHLQKRLGREGRRKIRFDRRTCNTFTNVIIVDDVITTGSTAAAAHLALGRPANCELWSVLDRRPCGGLG